MTSLTQILDQASDRKSFNCGKSSLDHYFHEQVGQDIRRKLAVCFVLSNKEKRIIGYYTLSNSSILLDDVPEELRKRLPKSYVNLPVTLLGRLAVDKKCQGTGIGKLLLVDALRRSYEVSKMSIGSMAVIVSPKDADDEAFYLKFGFVKLPDSGRMFLPMKSIAQLFQNL